MGKNFYPDPARWVWMAFFVVLTSALLAGEYAYYRSDFDRIQKEKYEDLAAIAELKASRIREWRKERLEDIGSLSRSPMFKRTFEEWLRDRKNQVLLEDLKDKLVVEQRTGGYADAILLRPDGQILLSAKTQPDPLSPVAKAAIEEALANRSPVLSDLYRNPRGTVLIDAVAPILDPKGQPIAAGLFRSNAESLLYPLIQSWPTSSRTAETLLIRKDGNGVLFLNDLRHRPNSALSLRKPLTLTELPAVRAVLGKQGMFHGKDYRGVDVLADLRPVPDLPWFMVAKVDSSEILSEARYRGEVTALFAGLFILFTAGVTAYGYRYRQARLYQDLYRSEREQREAQEQFRTTLYSIGDAVITTDTGGLVKQMNPVAELLTGWLEAEAKGKPLDEVFHIVNEDSREELESPVQRVLREGQVVGLANHTLLISKDGVERPIADSGAPIRDETSAITGVVLVFRDQTHERMAQQEVKESEERLELALLGADLGLWDWNLKTGRAVLNERATGMLGYSPGELQPDLRTWKSLIHPEDWPNVSEVLNGHVEGSLPLFEAEYRIRCKSGEWKWILGRGKIVGHDSDGKPLRMIGTTLDVTERKRAEEALRNLLNFRQTLINSIPDPVFYKDEKGKYIDCNDAFANLVGLSREDVTGKSVYEVAPKDLAELWRKKDQELFDDPHVQVFEYTMTRPDGPERSLVFHKAPLFDANGALAGLIGVILDITERKKAEDALAKSEERYRRLFDNAPIGIFQTTSEGQARYVNSSMSNMVGAESPEEAVMHFTRLSQQLYADSRRRDELIKILTEKGQVTDFEYEALRMDGSRRWFSMNARVSERSRDGSFLIEGFTSDITEQKLAQEVLRDSEEKYRATFNNAAVGIDLVDLNGRFLKANAVLSNFLGYTEGELRNLSILEVTHPEDLTKSAQMHDALVRGETESYKLEKRYVRKDGSVVWADTYVSAIRDSGGKHKAAVGVILDTTKSRKLAEIRLRLATAVEQVAETIVITDSQGTILYVNPAFARITGYRSEEAIGKNPRILKSGQHDDQFYKNMWEIIAAGRVWRGHLVNRKKDGSLFEEEVTISPIKNKAGKVINYVAVKRDVTKEISLQNQLLQAQKMEAIGTLAGGIAHDFNNLLQVTLGYSELLLTGKQVDNPEYADLSKIFQAAKSGAELVRRLLTFSRKMESKPVPLNLNRQIVQVQKILRRTIPKMIDIEMDLADDLAKIHADPTQMEQVLMNLAVNARDAMPDKGTLTIRTVNITLDQEYCRSHAEAKPGEYLLLTVSDTGHGMDKETVEHIFEPFYTTKELGRGTGLGLAIVYGIVKQHQGFINCYSEVEHGTTFNVYFPAIERQVEQEVDKSGVMPAFGTETILLVDDEEFVRDLGERILSRAGYTVLAAVNGKEALELFKKDRTGISLVILDLIMPEMGGTECLKELRKIDPNVKVLIASGLSAGSSMRESAEPGARGFVSKPFIIKELLRQVRKVLDQS